MKQSYQRKSPRDTRKLTSFFTKNLQLFLPFLELVERSSDLMGDVLDRVGQATIETMLELSASKIAGPAHQGKRGGPIRRHGRQAGVVSLSDRKLRVSKPRLRKNGGGEVEIPVYRALQSDEQLQRRVEELMMHGVSTRRYEEVIGELAGTVGVSKSSVSREFIESSARSMEKLAQRRFEDVDVLVIYLDGLQRGGHHVIGALGVDREGHKHVLGIEPGASENQAVVTRLLEGLVERGIDPQKRYLFVVDGAKALRSGIRRVFGSKQLVQRCRLHKMRNIASQLPKEVAKQVIAVMRAAFRCDAEEGIKRIQQQAAWLKGTHPSAANSLLEGLEELFTISKLGVSPSLLRCLATTNIIESPFGTIQLPMRRVGRWRNEDMLARWAASAFTAAEKRFRRIMGYKHVWQLEAVLRGNQVDEDERVA